MPNELYSKEELDFFNTIEKWDYIPLNEQDLKSEIKYTSNVAKNTIKKMTRKRSLNLRVFEDDITKIKVLALEKGIPYQTLISSLIHQFATDKVKIWEFYSKK